MWDLTWGQVKKKFSRKLCDQYDLPAEATVRPQLKAYEAFKSKTTILSHFSMSIPSAKKAALAKEGKAVVQKADGKMTALKKEHPPK